MIQINNLCLIHNRDSRVLVEDFDLSIARGDKIVIIGEEGNGKSTLLKWIAAPESIEDYAHADGQRIVSGERIGYLPQDLRREHRELSVYEYMRLDPLFDEALPGDIAKIEGRLGLPAGFLYTSEKMKQLSGGERVKIEIASLLCSEATVLLLDEPSNDIDISTLEWLESFINDSNCGIVFVSHDETLIENTATKVVHIEQLNHKTAPRHTVASMSYSEYIKARRDRFETQAHDAKAERRAAKAAEEKLRRIMQRVEHEQNTISRQDPHGGFLLKKKMHAVKAMERRFEREKTELTEYPHSESEINIFFDERGKLPKDKVILDVNFSELWTPGRERRLSSKISLLMRGGEKVCITGDNGCGKTTLLRLIKEHLEESKKIKFAYMPQNYDELLNRGKSAIEILTVSGTKEENVLICNRLASLRYTREDMQRPVSELSGGQRAKLLLLSLVLSGADLLILDEPTRNFSPLSGPVVRRMIKSFHGAVLSVSHDRRYIEAVSDKVYELTEAGLRENK